jgi:tripartite-type tricarboxylate transporter receptor subunit TctC
VLFYFLFSWQLPTEGVAQFWPSRPIRLVPLSSDGFADTPARMFAPRLSGALGKLVFVDNKPGAGAGPTRSPSPPPDRYNLLLSGTPHVVSQWLCKNMPYDVLKDFAPVALVASGPYSRFTTARRRSCGLQTMSCGAAPSRTRMTC